jgi:hypothetical protein
MAILMVMMGLLLTSVAALPTWPYSRKWGYFPTSACGVAVTGIAALVLVGRL